MKRGLAVLALLAASGCSSKSSVGAIDLPYDSEFEPDGGVVALVNADRFSVLFTPWGSHSLGNTGHYGGDLKSNAAVWLRPDGGMVELVGEPGGDGDGVCEPGESCGVSADTARASDLWYVAKHAGMRINKIEAIPAGGGYLPGDPYHWRIEARLDDLVLVLQHVAEPSPELMDALASRFGAAVRTNPTSVDFSGLGWFAQDVPVGMRLGRPQIITKSQTTPPVVGGETIYAARAQVEWTWVTGEGSGEPPSHTVCGYGLFSATLQSALQQALDARVQAGACWNQSGYPMLGCAAEGTLCTSAYFDSESYSAITTDRGYGWYDSPMPSPRFETVSVFPIHKDTAAWALYQNQFADPSEQYMVAHGIDAENSGSDTLAVSDGVSSYSPLAYVGEVVAPLGDLPTEGTLLLRITDTSGAMPRPAFQGVSYRLSTGAKRLYVSWGLLSSTSAAVVMPDAIPASPACDGQPVVCYSHERP